MRVITLIASATEIACALGLRRHLVGRSHECDYPTDVKDLPVLSEPKVDPALPGGTIDRRVREIVREGLSVYRIRIDELERLSPDLIVTQDHCDVCAVSLTDVENALCNITGTNTTTTCTLHPETLDDVRADFQKVADASGVPERGHTLVARFDDALQVLAQRTLGFAAVRVALWNDWIRR